MKILWLSDIHFQEEYRGNEKGYVEKYFNSFEKTLENEIKEIDYIIISGDLSFKGEFKSIHEFKRKFEFFNGVKKKILVIPGNHDIKWKNLQFEYFKENEDLFNNRKVYFEKNKNSLENSFNEYTNALLDWGGFNKIQNSNAEIGNKIEVCKSYLEKKLDGYLVDEFEKVIFVLLNSSWFSLGESYKEWISEFDTSKLNNNEKDFNEKLKKLMDYNKICNDRGYLYTGVNFEDRFSELLNDINDKYPDYLVISIMHHPLDWLNESELYNSKENEKTILYKLIEKTHLLLTGHIHPPTFGKGIRALDITPNLIAPQFLTYDGINQKNINCGFVILNINDFKLDAEYFYSKEWESTRGQWYFKGFKSENLNNIDLKKEKLNSKTFNSLENTIKSDHESIRKFPILNRDIVKINYSELIKSYIAKNQNINVGTIIKFATNNKFVFINQKENGKNLEVFIYKLKMENVHFISSIELINLLTKIIKVYPDHTIKRINILKFDTEFDHIIIKRDKIKSIQLIELLKGTNQNVIQIGKIDFLYPEVYTSILAEFKKEFRKLTTNLFNRIDDKIILKNSEIHKTIFNKIANTEFVSMLIKTSTIEN